MGRFKEEKKQADIPEPKTNVQRLMDIVNNRIDQGIKHPVGLPDHPQEIAKTWINFCEPRDKYEIADNILDPYQERIADCLKILYKLSHADQGYINQLRSKGIYWRGDSIEFMKMREKVTPEFLADKEKLRMTMRSMIAKMGRQL